jgi:hypothetical protein
MLKRLRISSSLAKTDFLDESAESIRTAGLIAGDGFCRAMARPHPRLARSRD